MILISHRGNINGKNQTLENHPDYIDLSLASGFDVEVDLWYESEIFYLGHDLPQFEVDVDWISDRKTKLWLHCKNIDALFKLKQLNSEFNYFWHQNDDVTITSKGYFWTYPGKKLTPNSIAVLPEIINFDNLKTANGICSDYVEIYRV